MAPGVEEDAVGEWGDVMGGEDSQGVVFLPVVADVGADRVEGKGLEMEMGKVGLKVVGPLVAESPVFETDVDEKVVHPGGSIDPVACGKGAAVGQRSVGEAAGFGRIDGVVESGEHVGEVLFLFRGDIGKFWHTSFYCQSRQDEKDNTQYPCHPINPCVVNREGKFQTTYPSAPAVVIADQRRRARGCCAR